MPVFCSRGAADIQRGRTGCADPDVAIRLRFRSPPLCYVRGKLWCGARCGATHVEERDERQKRERERVREREENGWIVNTQEKLFRG